MTTLREYAPTKYFTDEALDRVEVGFECEFAVPKQFDVDEIEGRLKAIKPGLIHHCYEDGPAEVGYRPVEAVTNWWSTSEALENLHLVLDGIRKLEAKTHQNSSCHVNITHTSQEFNLTDFWDKKRCQTLGMAFPAVGIHQYLDRPSLQAWCPSITHQVASKLHSSKSRGNAKPNTLRSIVSTMHPWARNAISFGSTYKGNATRIEFRVPGGEDYHTEEGEERIKAVVKICAAYVLGIVEQPKLMTFLAKQNIALANNLSNHPVSSYEYIPKARYVEEDEWYDDKCDCGYDEGNCKYCSECDYCGCECE